MTCCGHAFLDRSLAGLNFFTSARIFFMLLLSSVHGDTSTDIKFGILWKPTSYIQVQAETKRQAVLTRS
jgi:hypothetical protein